MTTKKLKVPQCALCARPYSHVRTHFPEAGGIDGARHFFTCEGEKGCRYYVEIPEKKYLKYAGTVLPGVTSPDWRPWKDGAEGGAPSYARPIVDYPGPPRDRYCDLCKRRVLTRLWSMDGVGNKPLRYGVCPHCQDVPLNSDRYRRLKEFGLPEAPYSHALDPSQRAPGTEPEAATQKLLTDFVKVRKGRKKRRIQK